MRSSYNRVLGALIMSIWVTCFLFVFGTIPGSRAIMIVFSVSIAIYAVFVSEKLQKDRVGGVA